VKTKLLEKRILSKLDELILVDNIWRRFNPGRTVINKKTDVFANFEKIENRFWLEMFFSYFSNIFVLSEVAALSKRDRKKLSLYTCAENFQRSILLVFL
jgi:hypothetical protein